MRPILYNVRQEMRPGQYERLLPTLTIETRNAIDRNWLKKGDVMLLLLAAHLYLKPCSSKFDFAMVAAITCEPSNEEAVRVLFARQQEDDGKALTVEAMTKHKVGDFSCGTMACAVGETPFLFKRAAYRTSPWPVFYREIPTDQSCTMLQIIGTRFNKKGFADIVAAPEELHATASGMFNVADILFDIADTEQMNHLFNPNGQKYWLRHDEQTRILKSDATAHEVAENICSYVALKIQQPTLYPFIRKEYLPKTAETNVEV